MGSILGLFEVCFGFGFGIGLGLVQFRFGLKLDWIGFVWKFDCNMDCHVPKKDENSDQLFHR